MPDKHVHAADTVGLSTKVEEDFIAPLTAIRGILEILRDFDDLLPDERHTFLDRAITSCKRLEQGVDDLSDVVYAAAFQANDEGEADLGAVEFTSRIKVQAAESVIEVDLSD